MIPTSLIDPWGDQQRQQSCPDCHHPTKPSVISPPVIALGLMLMVVCATDRRDQNHMYSDLFTCVWRSRLGGSWHDRGLRGPWRVLVAR